MAKRKKQPSKVQKRKAATPRARKLTKIARGKATKRTVARAEPKRARLKKAAKPVAVEMIAVEELSIPAPGVTTVTEIEEAEASQAS